MFGFNFDRGENSNNAPIESRYYSYDVIAPPAALPVSLATLKIHLRLDPTDTSQDAYLTLLLNAAIDFAQKYMNRIFIFTTFRTFRDFFIDSIELRRSPFVSLDSFEYLKDGSFVAVDPSLFYVTNESDYSKIVLKNNSAYPIDIDNQIQSVKIDFVAGYALNDLTWPVEHTDLLIAIMNHVSALYENRGDCDLASITSSLPATSRAIYNLCKIMDIC